MFFIFIYPIHTLYIHALSRYNVKFILEVHLEWKQPTQSRVSMSIMPNE